VHDKQASGFLALTISLSFPREVKGRSRELGSRSARSAQAMTILLAREHFQVRWSGCTLLIYPKSFHYFFLQTYSDYYDEASF